MGLDMDSHLINESSILAISAAVNKIGLSSKRIHCDLKVESQNPFNFLYSTNPFVVKISFSLNTLPDFI